MALSRAVLSELLDAFKSGDGLDLIKETDRLVAQELIEAELGRGVRRGPRRAHRDPLERAQRFWPRVLTTKAGDVELAIPKLEKGSFFPSIVEPRRCIDQALYVVVTEADVHGVSTPSTSRWGRSDRPLGSPSPTSAASARASTRWWGRSWTATSTNASSP